MSTENKLKEVLQRVEYGLAGLTEAEWLRLYFETLHEMVKDYKRQLDESRCKIEGNVLVDPDWRFGDDSDT
jgi:hypothetical protein